MLSASVYFFNSSSCTQVFQIFPNLFKLVKFLDNFSMRRFSHLSFFTSVLSPIFTSFSFSRTSSLQRRGFVQRKTGNQTEVFLENQNTFTKCMEGFRQGNFSTVNSVPAQNVFVQDWCLCTHPTLWRSRGKKNRGKSTVDNTKNFRELAQQHKTRKSLPLG